MDTRKVIVARIGELCIERGTTPNELRYIAGVPQSTIKSILNGETMNPGAVTIKKLCDGFEISIKEFFSDPRFERLEQETKQIAGVTLFMNAKGAVQGGIPGLLANKGAPMDALAALIDFKSFGAKNQAYQKSVPGSV